MATVSQFVDALGGTTAVARAIGVGPSTVSNWRTWDRLPDSVATHAKLKALAREKKVRLPPHLREPKPSAEPQQATP